MNNYKIPTLPLSYDLETKEILRQVNRANKKLAELKGVALSIPNEGILINTLTLQEAKDSSEVENIVTTQDELYKAELDLKGSIIKASEKEVMCYKSAMLTGFEQVSKHHILTLNTIREIQEKLVNNKAGFRRVPGTSLKNNNGEIVYTPPQDIADIERLMANLEQFINDESLCEIDPLIKMSIIHHQFESIHPFYDGNGRTGRIILILYLVTTDLLDLPVLYLSRFITHNKGDYYRLIQAVRDVDGDNSKQWKEWILFMLKGVEETAQQTIDLVKNISRLMHDYEELLRPEFTKSASGLLNNLFRHPYTKIEFVEKDLGVTRKTATTYLDKIVDMGLLQKTKIGKSNYYINANLVDLFLNVGKRG